MAFRNSRRWRRGALLLPLAASLLAGCASGPAASSAPAAPPIFAASFYPVAEFTRAVAGDRAQVMVLIPPGVEPHDWEPTPGDIQKISGARLLVTIGAGMEPWAPGVAAENPSLTLVELAKGIPLRPASQELLAQESSFTYDPHIWLDPVLAQTEVRTIAEAAAAADPAGAEGYHARAEAFVAQLQRLDAEYRQGLANCSKRVVLLSHYSHAYDAARYNFTALGISGLDPEAEPTPDTLRSLADLARKDRITVVFTEALVSPKVAETLAREVGARTLVLDPIEGLTEEGRKTGLNYTLLMEQNLRNLRTAMECR